MATAEAFADEESAYVAEVITVRVADEDLVQVVTGNLDSSDPFRSAFAHVENEARSLRLSSD